MKPLTPDLPKYLREPLEKQSPDQLEEIASYATELADAVDEFNEHMTRCSRF